LATAGLPAERRVPWRGGSVASGVPGPDPGHHRRPASPVRRSPTAGWLSA